jgi:hypothetical protein
MNEEACERLNVWLVALQFPPANAIGAERPKKFVRTFAESGFSTVVFSVERPNDVSVQTFCGAKVRRSAVFLAELPGASNATPSTLWGRLRRFSSKVITGLLDDTGWSWMAGLRRDLHLALEECKKPDVIIATGRPFLTFLTVSRFARKHRIPFILDYRDAWARNPHATYDTWVRRALLTWLEGMVNRHASAITTVSNLTAAALNTDKKPLVIYNLPDQGYIEELEGYTPDAPALSPDRMCLAFTGTLYPGRDLAPICAAIAQLAPESRQNIEVHYCGTSVDRAKAAFRRHGIEHCLISHGSLSKEDAIRLVAASDIALSVICSDTEAPNVALRGVITTKVFDYLILGKEVLNVVPEGFEFSTFADKVGISGLMNFEPGDLAGLTAFLRNRLEAKLNTGEPQFGSEGGGAALLHAWTKQTDSLTALLGNVAK